MRLLLPIFLIPALVAGEPGTSGLWKGLSGLAVGAPVKGGKRLESVGPFTDLAFDGAPVLLAGVKVRLTKATAKNGQVVRLSASVVDEEATVETYQKLKAFLDGELGKEGKEEHFKVLRDDIFKALWAHGSEVHLSTMVTSNIDRTLNPPAVVKKREVHLSWYITMDRIVDREIFEAAAKEAEKRLSPAERQKLQRGLKK